MVDVPALLAVQRVVAQGLRYTGIGVAVGANPTREVKSEDTHV